MTEAVQVAMIAAVPSTLVATAALIASLKNSAKLDHVDKVAVATHALSNSAMEAQLLANVQNLEMAAVFAHRLAESAITADIEAAKALDVRVEAAKTELKNHQIKQAGVDADANRN